MNVCSNCFSDKEIKAHIDSFDNSGECDICNTSNQNIIWLDELKDFFQELIDNFEPDDKGMPIKNKIQSNWFFFSNLESAKSILDHVIPKLKTKILNADSRVNHTIDILDNIGYWKTLKDELKWQKRFLTDIVFLTEELGWDAFFNTQYQLSNDVSLYRARVHHKSVQQPYDKINMKCPAKEDARAGRANSLGIPLLYLSDQPETTLYEVRASYLDELTIGQFRLNQDQSIKIVDFTEDTPLYQPERVSETIKAKLLREMISQDLSKPMRRYDSEIEYIPTQFICEFIKVFTGAEGIRFQSSIQPHGKNIVIFDQSLMDCVNTEFVRIKNILLKEIHFN